MYETVSLLICCTLHLKTNADIFLIHEMHMSHAMKNLDSRIVPLQVSVSSVDCGRLKINFFEERLYALLVLLILSLPRIVFKAV